MATALNLLDQLHHSWGRPWLVGLDNHRFWAELEKQIASLEAKAAEPLPLLVAPSDPLLYLVEALGAIATQVPIILGNPHWGQQEWQQVKSQLQSRGLFSHSKSNPPLSPTTSSPPAPPAGSILIATGGSSGQLKFAVHTWSTLTAAAHAFQQHFQMPTVNAYCTLPLHHISGFMQVIRVLTSGGHLAVQTFKELINHHPLSIPAPACISLVPTQLQRLLQQSDSWATWLSQFQAVLLGGAPAWPQLLNHARQMRIPLALTYGMTETAAQVAALPPKQFLTGATGAPVMPHAAITICDSQGRPQPTSTIGHIRIQAPSLCQGYWPLQAPQQGNGFLSDDLGYLDDQGYLHVVGRASSKIISGGENVFPQEVEANIRATGMVKDVCVLGLPDKDWGQVVTAIVALQAKFPLPSLLEALKPAISRYKQPKHWIVISAIPRSSQGKINTAELIRLAQTVLELTVPDLDPN